MKADHARRAPVRSHQSLPSWRSSRLPRRQRSLVGPLEGCPGRSSSVCLRSADCDSTDFESQTREPTYVTHGFNLHVQISESNRQCLHETMTHAVMQLLFVASTSNAPLVMQHVGLAVAHSSHGTAAAKEGRFCLPSFSRRSAAENPLPEI